MSWSDAARAAALEVRRRKAAHRVKYLDARTGFVKEDSRQGAAAQMRALRAGLRAKGGAALGKRARARASAQLANLHYAARRMPKEPLPRVAPSVPPSPYGAGLGQGGRRLRQRTNMWTLANATNPLFRTRGY